MRRYRAVPAVVFAVVVSALVGGFFGRSALAIDDKTPGLQDLQRRARRHRGELRRDRRVRQPRLQFDSRHARHARSALELFRSEGLRADARAAGRPLLRPRHPDSEHARRRHRRDRRLRRIAGVQEGRASRRRVREDRRRGREGLDDRAGDAETARPQGDDGAHRAEAPRLRTADSARRDARRGVHPDGPGRVHDRSTRPGTSSCRISARTPTAISSARLRDLDVEGHEAAAARHPRQSRRPARSGDQGRQRVPAARPDDRLHARPHVEFGSGLPRDRGRRVHEHPDRDDRQPQQRERVGDRHRRAAGSRPRASSSAKRRSARRSCSRSIASAAARAWR